MRYTKMDLDGSENTGDGEFAGASEGAVCPRTQVHKLSGSAAVSSRV